MPVNVIPRWIKLLVLSAALATGWYLWKGTASPRSQESSIHLAGPAPSLEKGLPGKAGANIRQFVSNPLEQTRLPGEETVILRDKSSNYYKDEP